MLPEISIINNALSTVEQNYSVIFNRNTAVIAVDNNYRVLHLFVDTWIVPFISPQEQICSAVAVIAPDDSVQILPQIVVTNVGRTAFVGANILDASGNILQSVPIFSDPPKPTDTLPPMILASPSIKDLNITVKQLPNGNTEVRVKYTADVSFFFGAVTYDLFKVDTKITFLGD
ncbi:MAG: hypothetical protein WC313_01375 [Candidatus Kapaibacterium sp.]|jgi:hypothetical protein